MATTHFAKPLVPEDRRNGNRRSAPLVRAAAALLLSHVESRHLKNVLGDRWPGDRSLELVVRAATAPATEANTPQIVALGVATITDLLGGASTSGRLLQLGIQYSFDGVGQIAVQAMVADPNAVAFVGPGSPIPVRKFSTSPLVILKPFKASSIVVFTNETLRTTTPNIETVTRQKLADDLDLGFDTLMLDTSAASATRPAGLRNNVAALTVSPLTGLDAMMADVAAVTAAVSSVARNAPIALIASPAQANNLRLWSRPNFPYEILSTSGLADKTLLAVATNCLVSAGDVPNFSVVDQAVVMFDDSSPVDVTTSSVGSGTIKSLFQSDEIGLRVMADVAWALRSSSGVAWVTGTNW